MKKYAAILFIALFICTNAVSNDLFTISVDSVMDTFYMRSFTGDYAVKRPLYAGSPYTYQGEGDISGFQSSAFDNGLNGRISLSYAGKSLGGLLEMRANTDSAVLDDWYWETWLRLGSHVRILSGNRGQRGQVDHFPVFDDFLVTIIDYFGVLFPAYQFTPHYNIDNNFDTIAGFPWGIPMNEMTKGYAIFSSTDTNDLFTAAGVSGRPNLNLLLDLIFEPVTVSFSVGGLFKSISRPFKLPWDYGQGGRANDYDNIYDPVLKNSTSFGIRVEGSEIADMLILAAVYKYADTLLYKPTAEQPYDVVGEATGNHAFGLYANIAPLNSFKISVGYSGLLQSWRNAYDTDVDPDLIGKENAEPHFLSSFREVNFPLYHGIDIRLFFTGIADLAITFNNNISFGRVYGADNSKKNYSNTWVYVGELNGKAVDFPDIKERYEDYLGFYNALGVKYALSSSFTVDFQAANQFGLFTLNWNKDSVSSSTNYLGCYLGASYSVIETEKIRASIRGGLDCKLSSFNYQDAKTLKVHKTGIIDFGIPLGVKVEF